MSLMKSKGPFYDADEMAEIFHCSRSAVLKGLNGTGHFTRYHPGGCRSPLFNKRQVDAEIAALIAATDAREARTARRAGRG